jgi:hypothetical protein
MPDIEVLVELKEILVENVIWNARSICATTWSE